jgi:hypothetical protein
MATGAGGNFIGDVEWSSLGDASERYCCEAAGERVTLHARLGGNAVIDLNFPCHLSRQPMSYVALRGAGELNSTLKQISLENSNSCELTIQSSGAAASKE